MSNPVVFFEIGCQNKARTEEFYSKLFDWKLRREEAATTIDTDGGIAGHIISLGHEPRHYTMFYVQVDDVQAALDKAEALGAKTLVPVIEIPTGSFAWLADPEGNTIGLIKPK